MGAIHRSRLLRHHISCGSHRQRQPRLHLMPPQDHEERPQHIHLQLGAGRPAHPRFHRPVRFHYLHGRLLALWRIYLQGIRIRQGTNITRTFVYSANVWATWVVW